jgi:SAM-dependent methyltransferase
MSDRIDRFLVEEITRSLPGGRVLDLPAGDGSLGRLLEAAAHTVTPADLFPEKLRWEGHVAVSANMNAVLPFDDARFDAVVSQEGIEHLENPASFLRECRRVLRPNGMLWLTTPNTMDLSSRLSNLLTGMKSFHGGFPNEHTTLWGRDGERLYHGHAFSLPYFQIRYLLRVCDFHEVSVTGLGRSGAGIALYPLVRPLSGLLMRRAFRKLAHKKPSRAPAKTLQDELIRAALSPALLCHRKICVVARAGEGAAN